MAGTHVRSTRETAAELLGRPDPIEPDQYPIIYNHYKPIVVSYAKRKGANDPEGIADLALLSGFNAINSLERRSPESFGYYLIRACLGHVTDEFRRRRPETIELQDHDVAGEDPGDNLVDRVWLQDLLANLTPDQRRVIELRFFEDLSAPAAGEQLGKDPNAVHQLQHRALRSLRRAIFPTVIALALVASLVAILRAGSGSTTVDSTPVDRTEVPTVVEERPPVTTAQRNDGDGADPPSGRTDEIEAGLDAIPTTSPRSVAPSGDAAGPAASSTPDSSAPPGTATSTTEPVPPSTTSTASTTPTTAVIIEPSTPLNACQAHLLSLDVLAIRLFNPQSDHGRAASFRPPRAVRFLDAVGTELIRIDTGGAMSTGFEVQTHGWMGEGGGTHAAFDAAPTPTYWGVLASAAETATWQTIQALDPSTNEWRSVSACP